MLVSSTFPLEDGGELIGTMETSVFYHKDSQLDGKNHWLTNPHTGLFRLEDIITRNPEMLALKDTVQRVAANPSPVLIWGETGTGKELFAQALHSHSTRSKGSFISQNCAAIPTTLLESTLFGTTRGSYTGAENRKGLLKQADGGTLFLDEVNSMDLSLQAKILKAIEEKKFRPVGGEQDVHSDVRIVSAMNVDPITAVRDGLLRRDLFYRLGGGAAGPAAPAEAAGGYPAAYRLLCGAVQPENGADDHRGQRAGAQRPAGLRLARQRAGAAKRGGVGL